MLDKISGNISIKSVTKISIVGSGISNHLEILNIINKNFEVIKDDIYEFDVSACKISILFNKIIETKYLNELHNALIDYIN